MAKRNTRSNQSLAELQIKSLQDLGYQVASHVDGERAFLVYAKTNIPGFPEKDKIPEEVVTQVKAGMLTRFVELRPVVHYAQDGEDTFTVTDKATKGGFECSVGYCLSLSRHEFGELKPNKKALVKKIRDDASTYCAIRWARLLKSADLDPDKASNTRKSNKLFAEWLAGILADMPKKAKNAAKAGDATAIDADKLRVAIEVFKQQLAK